MNGSVWRERFEQALKERGLTGRPETETSTFRGVGGRVDSKEAVTWPVGIFGCNGELKASQVDGNIPPLLPRAVQGKLGAHVHLAERTIDFDVLGIKGAPLKLTRAGHLTASLLEFSGARTSRRASSRVL